MFRIAIAPAHFCAGLLILSCSVGGSARAQGKYVTLFNGKDLSGWVAVGTPGAFAVRENSIYCTFLDDEDFREYYNIIADPWQLENTYHELTEDQKKRYEQNCSKIC